MRRAITGNAAYRPQLPAALREMQSGNIAPVDLAQAAIGPGMAVYSRYTQVLEANGDPLTVRAALQLINQELDAYLSEQEGDVDSDTRFVALIEGRELTRFGVRLQVLQQGRITGSGFGFVVGGDWEWRNGYFCRTLEFAGTGDPYNCQLVLRDGDTLRFIKDQGSGDYADLRLR